MSIGVASKIIKSNRNEKISLLCMFKTSVVRIVQEDGS